VDEDGVRDDRSLVLDFQAGSADAFGDIYLRYRPIASRVCMRILKNREDTEEAVQETMMRVLRGLPVFNGRYQLGAWIARIATNVSLDMIRARSRRPHDVGLPHEVADEPQNGRGEEPLDVVERIIEREHIRTVLEELPDHHRQALVLREFEGRSHEEIGFALGVTPSQAKALIHRAKRSFRRAWDEANGRRGIAALVPLLLAPFRLPVALRRLAQHGQDAVAGAREVVVNAGASASQAATQAAATVTASPVVVSAASSTADRLTAAAMAVVVAGSVGVGAVAISQKEHRAEKPKPSPAVVAAPPVSTTEAEDELALREATAEPLAKNHEKAKQEHAKPVEEPATEEPVVTDPTVPVEDPVVTDPTVPVEPVAPPPPPPAPEWAMTFDSSVPMGEPELSLVDSRVNGTAGKDIVFMQVASGPTFDIDGEQYGRLYVEYFGEAEGARSWLEIWLMVDTPVGRYEYRANGGVASVVEAEDGSTTYVLTAPYHLTKAPVIADGTSEPDAALHDGLATLTLKFWSDRSSLYASILSLDEAPAA
jgi:RNA polymerase sigma factor (sigma-70 family)